MAAKPWESSYPKALHGFQVDPQTLTGNAADFARRGAQLFCKKPAFTLVLPNGFSQQLSFQQIDQLSDAFASYLSQGLGLQVGEVIAIQLPNCLHYPIAVMGAWKAGLIVTNVNPLYTAHELEHQLTDSGAKVLLASDLFVKTAQPIVKKQGIKLIIASLSDFFAFPIGWLIKRKMAPATTVPEIAHQRFLDTLAQGKKYRYSRHSYPIALYQYTGGTTGRSKGAVLTHSNLLGVMEMAQAMISSHGIDFGPSDCILTVVPMYHIFAFNFNFLLLFKQGGCNLLIPNPRPLSNIAPAIKKFRISLMTGVDTLFAGLLAEPWFIANPPKLKMALSGGTALRPSTAQHWQEKVSTIVEGYGLTESSCFVSFNPPNENSRLGTAGLPLPGIDIRIVSDDGQDLPLGQAGELWIRGPNITSGYLNRQQDTEESLTDGWFHTGDVAQMDNEGYLSIVDRKKDMIIVSGFNVYPNEVEAVLAEHPDIHEVAVVGVSDANTGEAIRAFITLHRSGLTAEQVIAHCREHLTGYKVPKQIVFRDALPKSAVGKILRAQLRAEA